MLKPSMHVTQPFGYTFPSESGVMWSFLLLCSFQRVLLTNGWSLHFLHWYQTMPFLSAVLYFGKSIPSGELLGICTYIVVMDTYISRNGSVLLGYSLWWLSLLGLFLLLGIIVLPVLLAVSLFGLNWHWSVRSWLVLWHNLNLNSIILTDIALIQLRFTQTFIKSYTYPYCGVYHALGLA